MVPIRLLSFTLALFGFLVFSFSVQADGPVARGPNLKTPDQLAGFIDQEIQARLDQEKVKRASVTDDAAFYRRLWLDLGGRIPRVSEVREFLEDKAPDKRARAVEDLLQRAEHIEHFANTWQAIFTPTTANNQAAFFGNNLRNWLLQKVRDKANYREMVRGILSPPPPLTPEEQRNGGFARFNSPSSAFIQFNEAKPENLASSASRIFMGVRLECAQCHDHPFAKWDRDQFWQQAAFFADAANQSRGFGRPGVPAPAPNVKPLRQIKMMGTNKMIEAKFLDGNQPVWREETHPTQVFVDWLTADSNPYFAQTAANRIWAHVFGIGLNDPVDDEPTAESPISHPELLHELTWQFVAHNYDVNYLIRAITASKTYQSASRLADPKQAEPRLFARMAVRSLTPDQLFASLATATGYRETRPGVGRGFQFQGQGTMKFEIKGRFQASDRPTEAQMSILQALYLMNGKFITDATSLEKGTSLPAIVDAPFLTSDQKIETLYLAALSRRPRDDEMARMTAYVALGGPRGEARAAMADIFWALLNSSEFILNH